MYVMDFNSAKICPKLNWKLGHLEIPSQCLLRSSYFTHLQHSQCAELSNTLFCTPMMSGMGALSGQLGGATLPPAPSQMTGYWILWVSCLACLHLSCRICLCSQLCPIPCCNLQWMVWYSFCTNIYISIWMHPRAQGRQCGVWLVVEECGGQWPS